MHHQIRLLRGLTGLSVNEFAAQLRVSDQTVRNWEKPNGSWPTPRMSDAISEKFQMSIDRSERVQPAGLEAMTDETEDFLVAISLMPDQQRNALRQLMAQMSASAA